MEQRLQLSIHSGNTSDISFSACASGMAS
jgi:hypothetical protein